MSSGTHDEPVPLEDRREIGEMPTVHGRDIGPSVRCVVCDADVVFGINFCGVCGHNVRAQTSTDPMIGMIVADRYKIAALLGRGGMGVVYRCVHTRMGKTMAIKLLHGDLARDGGVLERFQREAQAASKLSSPHTVSVFDYGSSEGLTYLVMEFVAGEDLSRVLRAKGHLSPERVARISVQACQSLTEAHENGIIHRDVKPENFIVTRDRNGAELIKLLDFGLARLRDGEERNDITGSGALLGTPYYMSPEIIRGGQADVRSDIYALGAMMYRALVGTPPFMGSSPIAVLTRTLIDDLEPPSARRPDLTIPRPLEELVLRCLAKDAAQRPQTIEAVRQCLLEFLGQSDPSSLSDSGLLKPLGTVADEDLEVATRSDVELFEKRLRRGRIAGWSAALAFALLVLVAGVVIVSAQRAKRSENNQPLTTEREPNNSPTRANLIAPETEVRGRLANRITRTQGDVDMFRLAPRPRGRWRLRAELSPQPNIDTKLELFVSGNEGPVFSAGEAGIGERELIAGFTLQDGGEYFLVVHEDLRSGLIPSENVSDDYRLRYRLEAIDERLETEPNDSEMTAQVLPTEGDVQGFIESVQDTDVWCPTSLTAATSVRLEHPSMDLELRVVFRDGHATETLDSHRAGGVERVLVQPALSRPPCFAVHASTQFAPSKGDGEHPYTLRLVRP